MLLGLLQPGFGFLHHLPQLNLKFDSHIDSESHHLSIHKTIEAAAVKFGVPECLAQSFDFRRKV